MHKLNYTKVHNLYFNHKSNYLVGSEKRTTDII